MMTIRDTLVSILRYYLNEKNNLFGKNKLADNIRKSYLEPFYEILVGYGDRYVICGSPGKGNWADCPWIGIFDSIKTSSAQYGYYLVYLFDKNMHGVYLSLNQGVTAIKEEYKRNTSEVLSTRAEDFRCKLDFDPADEIPISLNSSLPNPKLYEKGNILAVYYAAENLPSEDVLEKDLKRFLHYYQNLVLVDTSDVSNNKDSFVELKQKRLHERFDRCGNVSLKVKNIRGYQCEACGLRFIDKYGKLGEGFIETHHLLPFALLKEGNTHLSLNDFVVLCSNCHRMIHRLDDPSNLEELRTIINKNK